MTTAGGPRVWTLAPAPQVTHLAVNESSAADVVSRILGDPQAAEALATRARVVHDLYLCPTCLVDYFVLALTAYRKRFGLDGLDARAPNRGRLVASLLRGRDLSGASMGLQLES